MTDGPPTDSLPFEVNEVEEDGDELILTYRNETGNSVTRRTYKESGNTLHEEDEEWMFNYRTGEWKRAHQFTHEYELTDNGERLVGDGSGWDGAGQAWREWFKHRHVVRLELRYPHDTVPEVESEHATPSSAVA